MPAPFGPSTATRSGPRRSSSTRAPVRITRPSVVSTTRPRGTSVAGRSTRMVAVLAQPRLGLVEPVAGRLQPLVVHLAGGRGRLLRAVLPVVPARTLPMLVRTALRAPWRLRCATTRSASIRSARCRRTSERAAVTACSAAACSASDLLGVRRVAAAVPPHRTVVQVADPVHPLEQVAVVADHEQRARPDAEQVVEPGRARPRRGCWSARRAAARRAACSSSRASPSSRPPPRRTARRGRGRGRRRAGRAARARPPRAPRRPTGRPPPPGRPGRRRRRRARAAPARTAPIPSTSSTAPGPVEGEVLGQVADLAGDRHRAGRRPQHAGGEPEQRGLAGAVGADQPGPAGGDQQVEAGRRRRRRRARSGRRRRRRGRRGQGQAR